MFSTLVFYQLEMEKTEGREKYDPSPMLEAINCFRNVAATAKFGLMTTIGKRYN
jgi:hypothetical protein